MKQLKGAMALWGILSCLFVSYGQQETLIKRINCGGNQVTGDDGFVNEADTTATEIAANGIALGAMYRLLIGKDRGADALPLTTTTRDRTPQGVTTMTFMKTTKTKNIITP